MRYSMSDVKRFFKKFFNDAEDSRMIMEMLLLASLQKAWPPLHRPPVKEGWCKLCSDRRVASDEQNTMI